MAQLDVGNAGHSSTDQEPPHTGKEFTANSCDDLFGQLIEHFRIVTNIEIQPLKVNKRNEQRVKQNKDHKETDSKYLKQEALPKARTKNKKKKKQDSTSITDNKVASQTNENPSAEDSKEDTKFPPYWLLNDVHVGLEKGELFKGAIRISTKSSQRAFVTNESSFEPDHLFTSELDRNRALEGDMVAFQFKSNKNSIRKRKTMVVVHILERVHSRITVGHLQPMPSNNKQFIMLIPRDYRLPKIRVPVTDCPDFYKNTNKFANMLFKAKISSWSDTRYAVGSIMDTLGLSTNLEAETAALLVENGLDVMPFPSEILQDIPLPSEIPVTELFSRKDLRKECIFTIDPLSAHDLDDALSCKVLSNGNFEIGVHIADVTFYLIEDSPLDKIVWKKATTVYLMDKVYHMLPEGLCKQCSFTPGTDKLAFSVFWEMTSSGAVIRHHFARTVINSCAQLAYEQAQFMIENPNNYKIRPHNLRPIFRGFTYRDLHRVVNHLHKLAVILRRERFKKGALSMGLPKVMLKLDEHNGEPCGYFLSEYKEAHKLVEEFMLLANAFVAQKIVEGFPNQALLRSHQPPNQYMLNKLRKTLDGYAIDIDIKSSNALQSSIINIQNYYKLDDVAMAVLHYLVAKTMRRAEYFCSANVKSDDFHHYALSMPIYTHFTSPIRRYADIVVHRLLASSLGYSKKRQWKLKHLTEIATSCNKQKFNAKSANDASVKVHLARYIFKNCPFVQNAAVVGIGNNYLEVLIAITGTIVRIYPKKADDDVKCSHKQHVSPKRLELILPKTDKFPKENCTIYLFSIVQVILYPIPRKMQFRAKLWRPVNIRSLL